MPVKIRPVYRTRGCVCGRKVKYPRATLIVRFYGGTWRTIYCLCDECCILELHRLAARTQGGKL